MTYALILPALTLEAAFACGMEEHVHTEDCITEVRRLVCGLEESEPVAGHTHTDECYIRELICQLDESEGHVHSEACFDENGAIVCGRQEAEPHVHSDECYKSILICDLEESEDVPGHKHTDSCYITEKVYTCGKEEHKHTASCYIHGDPEADIETAYQWETDIAGASDGAPLTDVVSIARTQINKRESVRNYIEDENGIRSGWNRFGAAFGEPYGEIGVMFVRFCYAYCGAELPEAESAAELYDLFLQYGWLRDDPAAGDVVFFRNDDGAVISAGIAVSVEENNYSIIDVVTGTVKEDLYDVNDPSIAGFGRRIVSSSAETTPEENAAPAADTPDPEIPDPEIPVMPETAEESPADGEPAAAGEGIADEDIGADMTAPEDAEAAEAAAAPEEPAAVETFPDEENPTADETTAENSFPDEETEAAEETAGEETSSDEETEASEEAAEETASDEESETSEEAAEETAPDVDTEASEEAADEETAADEDADASEEETADGEETAAAEETTESEETAENDEPDTPESISADVSMPAVSFEDSIFTNGVFVTVRVSADEGALPEGTSMVLTAVDGNLIREAVSEAVNGNVSGIYAVDITFLTSDGEPTEPRIPIHVKMISDIIREIDNPSVVHVDYNGEAAEVEQIVGPMPVDEVQFESGEFSVYAIVNLQDNIVSGSVINDISEIQFDTEYNLFVQREAGRTEFFTSAMNSNGCFLLSDNILNAGKWTLKQADGGYYICTNGKYVTNPDANKVGLSDDIEAASVYVITKAADGRFYFKLKNANKWLQYSGSGKGIRLYTDANNAANSRIAIVKAGDMTGTDPYYIDGKVCGLMVWNGGETAKAMTAAEDTSDHTLAAKVLNVMTNESDRGDKLYVPDNTSDAIDYWTFEWTGTGSDYKLSAQVKDGESTQKKYLKIDDDGLHLTDEENASDITVTLGAGIQSNQVNLKCGGKSVVYSGKLDDGFGVSGTAGNEWLYIVEKNQPRPEVIPDGYYKTYTAEKISVSDPSLGANGNINIVGTDVKDLYGKNIIVYTRSWNRQTNSYDYFAVNGRGKLVPCHESGDVIEWVGSTLDDIQWKLIEYTYEDGSISKYYELYNEAADVFLAPSLNSDPSYHSVSEDPIGLVLSGRTNGQYYSTILAWDASSYSYAGLKVDRTQASGANDDYIASCRRNTAEDFYFAVVQNPNVDDQLNKVATVDNGMFGITMKMVDFVSRKQMSDFLGNDDGGQVLTTVPGLLSTGLGADGYPAAMIGRNKNHSLAELYQSSNVTRQLREVNHLFMESTYRATGYYEYDSSQNYAFLKDNGDFIVYKELGTHDTGDKYTLKHGQFYPYNDLTAGRFAVVNGENLYSPSPTGNSGSAEQRHELPETDPRKYEKLYLIDDPDYFFGMELEAGFEQTPDGLDAWGHDIVFNFSGDDDFWLYVDGELVIDLGGIHSAVPGSVNFKTGKVNVNGRDTTLKELFYSNRYDRFIKKNAEDPNNPTNDEKAAAAADALSYVNGIFVEKQDPEYGTVNVFADNTPHTMRIFYMERGAGASNLHMRFNLAAVPKGAVQLTKKLADSHGSTYARFPYQVYYRYREDPDNTAGSYSRLTNSTSAIRSGSPYYHIGLDTVPVLSGGTVLPSLNELNAAGYMTDYVLYKDSSNPAEFEPYLDIGGQVYNDVFFLTATSPTNAATINFPKKYITVDNNGSLEEVELEVEYYIVECGVDPMQYTGVSVNNIAKDPTDTHIIEGNNTLNDYATSTELISKRSSVNYVNTPAPVGSLTFTKNLYGADGNRITNDPNNPKFNFRLYFGSSFDSGANTPAYMYVYHVKDENGNYCRWIDAVKDGEGNVIAPGYFETILHDGAGVSDFSELSDDTLNEYGEVVAYGEKTLASFDSSVNGSITDIPADYTVEVLNMMSGTKFKVIERPTETPEGYHLWKYHLNGEEVSQEELVGGIYMDDAAWRGVEGTIASDDNSEVIVDNMKGYAVLLKKNWNDASTVTDRDTTFFAVYRNRQRSDAC